MEEDELVKQKADTTLLGAYVKLVPQLRYKHKITAASTDWASKGEKVSKRDLVGEHRKPQYEMTLDRYMSVSTMSIRFYIVAKLPLHYLELSIAFSGCTRLG